MLNYPTDWKTHGVYLERLSEVQNQTHPKHITHVQTTLVAHVSTLIAIHFLGNGSYRVSFWLQKSQVYPFMANGQLLEMWDRWDIYERQDDERNIHIYVKMKVFIVLVTGSHPKFNPSYSQSSIPATKHAKFGDQIRGIRSLETDPISTTRLRCMSRFFIM